jgi:protein-arginine kinase activator protein McsA
VLHVQGTEATVHLTQTVRATNQIRNVDLCEQCAESNGLNDPARYSLAILRHATEFSTHTSRLQK